MDEDMTGAKQYVDNRGRRYRVMRHRADSTIPTYRARYCKPGEDKWWGVLELPIRALETNAQEDLDKMAKREGWTEISDDQPEL